MAFKQTAWTQGLGVELEIKSSVALRQGFYTTITPSAGDNSGWVEFAISTPVIVSGKCFKARGAGLRLVTGSNAVNTNFHVYDGEKGLVTSVLT